MAAARVGVPPVGAVPVGAARVGAPQAGAVPVGAVITGVRRNNRTETDAEWNKLLLRILDFFGTGHRGSYVKTSMGIHFFYLPIGNSVNDTLIGKSHSISRPMVDFCITDSSGNHHTAL